MVAEPPIAEGNLHDPDTSGYQIQVPAGELAIQPEAHGVEQQAAQDRLAQVVAECHAADRRDAPVLDRDIRDPRRAAGPITLSAWEAAHAASGSPTP